MKTLRTIPSRARREGFSLAELMVVIVILGLLATIVVPNVYKYLFKANTTIARTQITSICQAIDNYAIENAGRPPDNIDILVTPDENGHTYLNGGLPLDPWKNPYVYLPPSGGRKYELMSYGADGQPGGEGDNSDISNLTMNASRQQ